MNWKWEPYPANGEYWRGLWIPSGPYNDIVVVLKNTRRGGWWISLVGIASDEHDIGPFASREDAQIHAEICGMLNELPAPYMRRKEYVNGR